MVNVLLLLFSSLLLCLPLLYFKRKWPDLDVVDIYIIFIALHFGLYPFIRGLYFGKGLIYDSYHSNPLVVGLVFLQILSIIIIIRVVSAYFPAKINDYLKIKTLIRQWARVNNCAILSISGFIILFQIISYYKYGVKAHISADDFARMGRDLPYWLTSMRTIYNYLVIGVSIVLFAKASRSEGWPRYFWIALIIIMLPFGAYFGRKTFANIVVVGVIIWLVSSGKKIDQVKFLKIAALMMLSFVLMSNMYQTYRPILQTVGFSLRQLENPITAALNFKGTLQNLKDRPGTWEFDYLVLDRQLHGPGKATTDGKITREGLKSAIPRLLWPNKKYEIMPEILSKLYGVTMEDVNVGSNIFAVAQLETWFFFHNHRAADHIIGNYHDGRFAENDGQPPRILLALFDEYPKFFNVCGG